MKYVALAAVLLALAVLVYDRLRLRRTMNSLDRMLDDAVCGAFVPTAACPRSRPGSSGIWTQAARPPRDLPRIGRVCRR